MKTEILALLIGAALVVGFAGQLNMANVQASSTLPSTAPATVSVPRTAPVILPITFHYLGGQIQGYTISNFKLRLVPLENIIVTIRNLKSSEVKSVKTDKNGNFKEYLPEGRYLVIPTGGLFTPQDYIANLIKDITTLQFTRAGTFK